MKQDMLVEIIPTRGPLEAGLERFVALMQSLVVDRRHPVALEIVGEQQARRFLIRTKSSEAMTHVLTQIQARLPQVQILLLDRHDDPLLLKGGEVLTVRELRPGEGAWAPLRRETFREQEADPVLAVLGAMDQVPEAMRVISQMALLPASPTWARGHLKRLEEGEQAKRRMTGQSRQYPGPSLPLLLFMAAIMIVLGLLATQPDLAGYGPALRAFLRQLVQGQISLLQFAGLFFGGLLVVALFTIPLRLLTRRLPGQPISDQKLIQAHLSGQAYHVRLRCVAIGPACDLVAPLAEGSLISRMKQWWTSALKRLKELLIRQFLIGRVEAAYRQFDRTAGAGNYLVSRRPFFPHSRLRQWSIFLRFSRHLMACETVAWLWHLPPSSSLSHLVHVTHTTARTLPPSPPLIKLMEGRLRLGECLHAGHAIQVAWPQECLLRHQLVAGKSGEGKSTWMIHMALAAMQAGFGLLLVDPHGDLADAVLAVVPEERVDEVVWVDLSDTVAAVGLNPLDARLGRPRDAAVSQIITALKSIWESAWGPRMENALEFALRTLFEANKHLCEEGREHAQHTLLDVTILFNEQSFCHALLEKIEDPYIHRWWHLYYDPLNLREQRERIDPVLSKLAKFEHTIARAIVGQSRSTINMAECISEGRIVLCKLAKGVIGEDIALILGATLVNLMQGALEAQGEVDITHRRPLPILVDEFQTLPGVDWSGLAELRKYGAAFTLATQSFGVLKSQQARLLPTLLANINQYVMYHMSFDDARLIASELGVEPEDLVHLPPHTAYLKLIAGGGRHGAFSARIDAPARGSTEIAREVVEQGRKRYATPFAFVEQALLDHLAYIHGMIPKAEPSQKQKAPPSPPLSAEPASRDRAKNPRGKGSRKKQGQGNSRPMGWNETVGHPGETP
jgi:hypothetical protein